jgi:leucyl-tRNA synthetase
MAPFIPHFTSECLDNLGQKEIYWPMVLKDQLIEESINLVIQINGKKRALLKIKRDTKEKDVLREIQLNKETMHLLKKEIQKTIFVSNRLINIIL